MVLCWDQDAGKLGTMVVDYLNQQLAAEEMGHIEPGPFYSFDGVRIEGNVIQCPETRFYICPNHELLTVKASPPHHQHHSFLNTLLDLAQHSCRVTELYTIGGMMSLMAHSNPRIISTVTNQPTLRDELRACGLDTGLNFQTPFGGHPTLNSYLLWLAQDRDIAGANLWVQIPFYLAVATDLAATKYTLWFLDKKLGLGLDFTDLDQQVDQQNARVDQLRAQDQEINGYINKLENGITLDDEENAKLTGAVTTFLEQIS